MRPFQIYAASVATKTEHTAPRDRGRKLQGRDATPIRKAVDPMRMTLHLVALLLFLPCSVRTQETVPICVEQTRSATPAERPPVQQALAAQNPVVQEKHPRLFWIIPTYAVSNSKLPTSLSSAEKFRLFVQGTTDPFTVTLTAFTAGVQQANNDLSGYGQGAAGYGKRLGAALADETSSGFFRTYLFPSVLHQDPRYFREGSGVFKQRLAHAIIRPVVTRKDSGGRAFNWSGLLGLIAASSLSNAYYPPENRGVELTFKRVATAIPFDVVDHLMDEFGPDLEKKFLRRK